MTLHSTTDAFIFLQGVTLIGRLPYDTLCLSFEDAPTEEQKLEMRAIASEFVPGQVLSLGRGEHVVLGPAKEFSHMVTLHACGNPDHGQFTDVGPRKRVKVCSVEEAVNAVLAYQDYYNMGWGNCGKRHGEVWSLTPKGNKRGLVGKVAYNGRLKSV